MSVYIARENPAEIIPDLNRVFEAQWNETEIWRGAPFNPREDYFHKMNDAGAMVCVTARRTEDDEVIGALMFVCGNDPLDQQPYATDMGFYVHPEHRGGTLAVRMLAGALTILDEMPLSRVIIVDKEPLGGADLSRLLAKFGFNMHARSYVRRRS